MTKPSQRRSLAVVKQRIARRHALARWAESFRRMAEAMADITWDLREDEQGWENVRRLNLYLARRRALDSGYDPASVRAPMPSLGPKATPEAVMRELRKLDTALRSGDFEEVAFTRTDDTMSLGKPAMPHDDTELAPYDGPDEGIVLAAQPDGRNVPSRGAATLFEQARRERAGS